MHRVRSAGRVPVGVDVRAHWSMPRPAGAAPRCCHDVTRRSRHVSERDLLRRSRGRPASPFVVRLRGRYVRRPRSPRRGGAAHRRSGLGAPSSRRRAIDAQECRVATPESCLVGVLVGRPGRMRLVAVPGRRRAQRLAPFESKLSAATLRPSRSRGRARPAARSRPRPPSPNGDRLRRLRRRQALRVRREGRHELQRFAHVARPLWTATTGGAVASSPAVVNGVVYVGSATASCTRSTRRASTNCSGSPASAPRCGPRPPAAAIASSPAVANGVVYVGSTDGKLYAFDAKGTTNCSGGVCSPLWTATTGGPIASSPAAPVANGRRLRRLQRRQALRVQRRRHHQLHGRHLHPAVDRHHRRPDRVVALGRRRTSSTSARTTASSTRSAPTAPPTARPAPAPRSGPRPPAARSHRRPPSRTGVVYVGSNDGKLYRLQRRRHHQLHRRHLHPAVDRHHRRHRSHRRPRSPTTSSTSAPTTASSTRTAPTAPPTAPPAPAPRSRTATTGGPVTASPAVADGVVYVGSADTRLHVFRAAAVPDDDDARFEREPVDARRRRSRSRRPSPRARARRPARSRSPTAPRRSAPARSPAARPALTMSSLGVGTHTRHRHVRRDAQLRGQRQPAPHQIVNPAGAFLFVDRNNPNCTNGGTGTAVSTRSARSAPAPRARPRARRSRSRPAPTPSR